MSRYILGHSYPENWDDIRRQVLKRDSYKCCNDPSHSTAKLHVHHIVPLSKGETSELCNLKTICEECHKRIHPYMKDEEPKVAVRRKPTQPKKNYGPVYAARKGPERASRTVEGWESKNWMKILTIILGTVVIGICYLGSI